MEFVYITKRFSFEAAHHLPNYKGACHNLHGHSYKVEVTIGGTIYEKGEKKGMILDFKDLKEIIKSEIGRYDHKNLNDYFENPTAEVMAVIMFKDIKRKLGELSGGKNDSEELIFLKRLRLWETEDSYATIEEKEM